MEVHYVYDGSFEGFLCCVFESYHAKEIPSSISSHSELQLGLFGNKTIHTNEERAARVFRSLPFRLGEEGYHFLLRGFLTCIPHREYHMLLFLRAGFRHGPDVMNRWSDPSVLPLFQAVKSLDNEAHHYAGFLRFSIHDERLYAQINPKNRVLPLLLSHFKDRFPNEAFLIYDKNHREVLFYEKGEHILSELAEWKMPAPDEEERSYQNMWKEFYKRIAIDGRINPKLRQNNMPKRFWPDMVEFH